MSRVAGRLSKHYDLELNSKQIEDYVSSHPDFPSLSAITDLLKGLGIEHATVKVSSQELIEAETPFYAYMEIDGEKKLILVENQTDISIHAYPGSRDKIKRRVFDEQFKGVAILLGEKKQKSSINTLEKSNQKLANFFSGTLTLSILVAMPLAIGILNEWNAFTYSHSVLLLTTKLLGLALTSYMILKEEHSLLEGKVCNLGSRIDCNSVLTSKYATIFGLIKWSDLGWVYFYSTFVLLMYGTELIPVIHLMSILACLYVPISLYQQGILIRKWCVFCLATICLILTELIINFNNGWLPLTLFNSNILTALGLALIGIIVFTLARILQASSLERDKINLKYQRLKNDPEVFLAIMGKSEYINFTEPEGGLMFGSEQKDAIRSVLFLSLGCVHCAAAFENLLHHVRSSSNIQWRLVLAPNNKKEINLLAQLSAVYEHNPDKALDLLSHWYSKPQFEIVSEHNKEYTSAILLGNMKLVKQFNAREFPTQYVENFRMAKHYELEDYLKFSSQLKQLAQFKTKREMIINT